MSHFHPRRPKPGNEDLFTTMAQGSAGKEVSSRWGGGGDVPAVTVTLFQTLFAVVKRRMMKKLTLSRFLASVTFSLLQPQRKFHGRHLKSTFHVISWKILRYRAPLNPRRDGQAIKTGQSLIDSDTHTYHEVVDKNWMSNFWMLAS